MIDPEKAEAMFSGDGNSEFEAEVLVRVKFSAKDEDVISESFLKEEYKIGNVDIVEFLDIKDLNRK